MKLRGWRLAESYKWVKDKRPNIKISEGAWLLLGAINLCWWCPACVRQHTGLSQLAQACVTDV
jgi:hypothetical protein